MNFPWIFLAVAALTVIVMATVVESQHDYGDALTKSILFFEGQRSGKLPPTQRLTWRKDSALRDGSDNGVDLTGGYYDAGDNVKFNLPMAFTITNLAWGAIEYGKLMGPDRVHALEAIRWGTDYLLKCTSIPGRVFAQVGEPYGDHNCWERPEDMDTPRNSYYVDTNAPGTEVAAETAAALAASSLVFKTVDPDYSKLLLARAIKVFEFADTYRGSYNDSIGKVVCPFYCSYNGYQDDLLWGAAWLFSATNYFRYWNYSYKYWNYVKDNLSNLGGTFAEYGWDAKHAGVYVLVSKFMLNGSDPFEDFVLNADRFACSILPESPTRLIAYSSGGLMFKPVGSNLQHATALSFLLTVYSRYNRRAGRVIDCGNGVTATPSRLLQVAKSQVDYILGSNPLQMSYMVGYGGNFPQKIHHRGSSLPSIDSHPERLKCQDGSLFFNSPEPNLNLLVGAVVGGPDILDRYNDSRFDFTHTEPTTYINGPLVGLLAFFKKQRFV
ncbi:hypothetical protein MLD38_008947 [Melastoma candidum]|uniref:Uncharacterized protein n=1 Tax=Melastoma candidum TaxID=119954 RepID=A0ACB9RVP1_9MYRT|nr:hypothetical protein MLD38_008947 [Melastoma candidum]